MGIKAVNQHQVKYGRTETETTKNSLISDNNMIVLVSFIFGLYVGLFTFCVLPLTHPTGGTVSPIYVFGCYILPAFLVIDGLVFLKRLYKRLRYIEAALASVILFPIFSVAAIWTTDFFRYLAFTRLENTLYQSTFFVLKHGMDAWVFHDPVTAIMSGLIMCFYCFFVFWQIKRKNRISG